MRSFSSYLAITNSLKGGGGKSTLACALLDFMRRHNLPIAAHDADGAIGSLSDMHATRDDEGRMRAQQDPLTGVLGYNIRDESRAMLIDSLQHGHRHILHDVAGGALMDMQRLFSDRDSLRNLFRVLQSLDACMVFLHVVTPDASTVESVALHLDLTDGLGDLADHARHVAVLNRHGNRNDQDFPHWFGYTDANGDERGGKTRQRLLDGGGAEMDLPALNDRTMAMLKVLQVPFAQAARDPRLTLVDQQRVRIFCEDFDAAMVPQVRSLLELPA